MANSTAGEPPAGQSSMEPEVLAAIIAGGIGVLTGFLSIVISAWSAHQSIKTAAKLQASKESSHYTEPLARAACSLARRLHKILETGLVDGDAGDWEHIKGSTTFLFAEYFAWTEFVRRDIQLVDLGENHSTRKLLKRIDAVADVFDVKGSIDDPHQKPLNAAVWLKRLIRCCFTSRRYYVGTLLKKAVVNSGTRVAELFFGMPAKTQEFDLSDPYFQIFTVEQRQIGDWIRANTESYTEGRPSCISEARFHFRSNKAPTPVKKLQENCAALIENHRLEIKTLRLRVVQNCLVDLLDVIDPSLVRFEPKQRKRVRLGNDCCVLRNPMAQPAANLGANGAGRDSAPAARFNGDIEMGMMMEGPGPGPDGAPVERANDPPEEDGTPSSSYHDSEQHLPPVDAVHAG
jgi:hypothetical protein